MLAQRAGSVVPGTGAVRAALRRGEVKLVLMASDASATQTDKVRGLLGHQEIPSAEVGTKVELGHALGAAPVSIVGITEAAFARSFLEKLQAAEVPAGSRPDHRKDDTHAG